MKVIRGAYYVLLVNACLIEQAMAADFERSLESLVNSLVGKILPILTLGYVGKHIFSHVQGDPNAKRETPQVAVATIALLGIQGVWAWLRSNVR